MVVVLLLKLLLLQLLPCATPLSFNFPSFPSYDNLSHDGNTSVDGSLRLTPSARDKTLGNSTGIVTYHQPFLLRENATGKLADFTTNFTFSINSQGSKNYGDGLTFFLAPNGSTLDRSIAGGGALGLAVEHNASRLFPFVAVEFDIFENNLDLVDDPAGEHVGIDINSLKSKVTKPWNGSITTGKENTAWIRYYSGSENLSVVYTSVVNGVPVLEYLDYKVDLSKYLQGYVVAGFSAATGSCYALHTIHNWYFSSTELRDDNEMNNQPPEPPSEPPQEPNPKVNAGLLVGLVVGGCVVLVGGLILVWCICWRKSETGESSDDDNHMVNDSIDEEFEKGTGPKKFSYKTLAQSTGNFDEGEKLGEGGFGGVYRGFIKDLNSFVAVKRVSSRSKQGMKEYAAEVRIISRLRHRNLVQLIGWCHEKRELLLVYEFMSNGSLDSHLFKPKTLLPWEARYRIAQGLASGLLYLHEEWEQCVLHRDIKSSNIMLDSNFNAKLGDFGLARLVDHGKQSHTTIVAGTRGYMALEYIATGKASKESDVYSFGVVALEIACGRKPIDLNLESSQTEIVEWVWKLYGEGKVIQAADPKLSGYFDEEQMERLMVVGLWCAHPDFKFRPSIQQAIQVLNFEVPLPILPSKMPVASYVSLPA